MLLQGFLEDMFSRMNKNKFHLQCTFTDFTKSLFWSLHSPSCNIPTSLRKTLLLNSLLSVPLTTSASFHSLLFTHACPSMPSHAFREHLHDRGEKTGNFQVRQDWIVLPSSLSLSHLQSACQLVLLYLSKKCLYIIPNCRSLNYTAIQ